MRGSSPLLAAVAIATVALVSGCGSSSSGSAAAAPPVAAIPSVCTQVGAALSDGPDPGADPVGYAEAQIKPLAAIHTANAKLASAITALDHAYKGAYATGDSPASKTAVRTASRAINTLCPGAAS